MMNQKKFDLINMNGEEISFYKKFLALKLAGLTLFILLLGCQNLPTTPAKFSQMPIRGVTLVDWDSAGYVLAEEQIKQIHAVGANHLAIIVTRYQAEPGSNEIYKNTRLRSNKEYTPNISAVRTALENAAELYDLKLIIKPHVDLEDESWRGHISPTSPDDWFSSYHSFLKPWAELAASLEAAQFVIGTELAGTLQYEKHWSETIDSVKCWLGSENGNQRVKLLYAASWDEAHKVSFWHKLDYVGVDFYFPLVNRKDPSRLEILSGWQPWLNRLQLLHQQTSRNIILTEIGYQSVDGAGMQPYAFATDSPLDTLEQADLYWAALQATSDLSWLVGLYWWNWPAIPGGIDLLDYTPAGKPAEKVLGESWSSE